MLGGRQQRAEHPTYTQPTYRQTRHRTNEGATGPVKKSKRKKNKKEKERIAGGNATAKKRKKYTEKPVISGQRRPRLLNAHTGSKHYY